MPRTKEQIKEEIDYVENQLSPENLSWDGERPKKEIKRAMAQLTKRLKELQNELVEAIVG